MVFLLTPVCRDRYVLVILLSSRAIDGKELKVVNQPQAWRDEMNRRVKYTLVFLQCPMCGYQTTVETNKRTGSCARSWA